MNTFNIVHCLIFILNLIVIIFIIPEEILIDTKDNFIFLPLKRKKKDLLTKKLK